jgi:HYR domain/Secretion system C-terminal sorting domain
MKNIIKTIKISLFVTLSLFAYNDVWAQCVTPVITSISNDGPACEGESVTLSATGTVGGVSSSSVRMAGIGANFGNNAFNSVFSSGDRAGSIARITNAQFDALFSSETNDAARAAKIKLSYDVLMFTWSSPNDANITWGLITAYLNTGGSVFFDGDFNNIDNLYDGSSNSVVGSSSAGSLGCSYTLVSPAPFPSLVANGVSGCFINHHTIVSSWPSWMKAYITGGSTTYAIAGIYPNGNQGRLIIQGPDQDYHASRGAGGTPGNQYQIILNQMDFLSANQAGFTWTGPNGYTSNDANPILSSATAAMSGTYTATLTNVTGGGCSTTATTSVTVYANPTIECPSDITVDTDDGLCGAVVTYSAAIGGTSPTVTNSHPSGTFFPVGTTTVTITATNDCSTETCTFDVTVKDTEPPVIIGENSNITVNFNAGSGTPVSYTESDITFLSLYASTSHVHLGDNNGDGSNDIRNHSSCCSTPYRLTVGSGVQYTLVSMEVKSVSGNPTFQVWPSGAIVTITSTGTYTFPSSFANVTEVRWSQSSGFMVVDNMVVSTKITGSCPKDIVTNNDPGKCGANVEFSAGVEDNCSASIAFSPASGSFFSVGSTTVTATATDASGNTSSCTFKVKVNDTEAPKITSCPTDIAINNDAGKCGAIATWSNPVVTDNCGYSTSSTHASGDFFPVGTTTVTYTFTDEAGNSATCSFSVKVSDTEAPVANCQDATVTLSGGTASISTSDIDLASSDNCSIASLGLDNNAFDCNDIGDNTVTLTVTDGSGNTNSCQATVEVIGVIPVVTIDESEMPGFCQGGLITLTAQPENGSSFSYDWSTSETTQSIDINASDDYVVEVTNNFGCTAEATASIDYINHELRSSYSIIACREVHLDKTSTVKSGGVGVLSCKGKIDVKDDSKITASNTFAKASNIKISKNGAVTTQIDSAADIDLPTFAHNPYCKDCKSSGHGKGKSGKHKGHHDHSSCKSSCKYASGHGDDEHECRKVCYKKHHRYCSSSCSNSSHHHCHKSCKDKKHDHCDDSDCISIENIKVGSNKTVTLTDSVYGKVSIGKNSTVTFTQPVLYLTDLKTGDDVTIKFSGCTKISICEKVDLKKNNTFNSTDETVVIYSEGDVKIHQNSTVNASIYTLKELHTHGEKNGVTEMKGLYIAEKVHSHYTNWNWNTECNSCQDKLNKVESDPIAEDRSGLEDANQVKLTVYPNPNRGDFGVDVYSIEDGTVSVTVYNLTGKVVFNSGTMELVGPTYIPIKLDNVAKATYYVRTIVNGKIYVKPVIINPTAGF